METHHYYDGFFSLNTKATHEKMLSLFLTKNEYCDKSIKENICT